MGRKINLVICEKVEIEPNLIIVAEGSTYPSSEVGLFRGRYMTHNIMGHV